MVDNTTKKPILPSIKLGLSWVATMNVYDEASDSYARYRQTISCMLRSDELTEVLGLHGQDNSIYGAPMLFPYLELVVAATDSLRSFAMQPEGDASFGHAMNVRNMQFVSTGKGQPAERKQQDSLFIDYPLAVARAGMRISATDMLAIWKSTMCAHNSMAFKDAQGSATSRPDSTKGATVEFPDSRLNRDDSKLIFLQESKASISDLCNEDEGPCAWEFYAVHNFPLAAGKSPVDELKRCLALVYPANKFGGKNVLPADYKPPNHAVFKEQGCERATVLFYAVDRQTMTERGISAPLGGSLTAHLTVVPGAPPEAKPTVRDDFHKAVVFGRQYDREVSNGVLPVDAESVRQARKARMQAAPASSSSASVTVAASAARDSAAASNGKRSAAQSQLDDHATKRPAASSDDNESAGAEVGDHEDDDDEASLSADE